MFFGCQQHNFRGRTERILALVPIEHAPSDTSDKSDTNSDDKLNHACSISFASSPPPSIDSSLERMNILSSPEPDELQCYDNNNDHELEPYQTEILEEICPTTPTREPNYDNIPSLSSILLVPSNLSIATPESHFTRKTRTKKQIAPVAKRAKKVPKFVLTYQWKKSAISTPIHN